MKNLTNCILVSLFLVFSSANLFAWEGYDYEKGNYVEIEKGNLVREGETIEIYDYEDGEYKDVDVESIDRNGSTVEIEVYDSDTGENRTIEMED
jgi:hypothetical protein